MNSRENENGLQKINTNSLLPFGAEFLSDEDKKSLAQKDIDGQMQINHEFVKKVRQSQVAEHDMAVFSDNIKEMDSGKKYYSAVQKIETGSGSVTVSIKGGDTKFIVPVIAVISLAIIGILVAVKFFF